MKKTILLSLLGLYHINVLACEPASLQWDELYQQINKPIDSPLSFVDFQKIQNFPPYPWPKAAHYQGLQGAKRLFEELDQNHDAYVDAIELADIYRYLPNPCSRKTWW